MPLGQPVAFGLREALLQAVELRVAAGETVELVDSVEFGDGEEEAVRAALGVLLALCEELRVAQAVEEGEWERTAEAEALEVAVGEAAALPLDTGESVAEVVEEGDGEEAVLGLEKLLALNGAVAEVLGLAPEEGVVDTVEEVEGQGLMENVVEGVCGEGEAEAVRAEEGVKEALLVVA